MSNSVAEAGQGTATGALAALPLFVINLDRDPARRQHMAESLAALGLRHEFVSAVDGRQPLPAAYRAAYDPEKALRVYGVPMWDTEIACYVSHRNILERMVAEAIPVALVLEDDVHLEPFLPRMLADILASPCQDWLVVRLDSKRTQLHNPSSAHFLGDRLAELPGGGALYRLRTHVLGTGGYLVRLEGARRILAYGHRIFMPIDHTIDRFWENGVQPVIARPFPVLQKHRFGSSTGISTPDRRTGQSAAVQLRRRVARGIDGVRKRMFLLMRGR